MSYIGCDPIYYMKPTFRYPKMYRPTKKNLFENFQEEDSLDPSEDSIKVYLRLKPTEKESDVIQVLDSRTILFKMPLEYMQARNKLNMPDQYKYSFSHIYKQDTTQTQIYSGCVAPLIKDVFNGQHCLLFTYGTTNAGKTFTVLGTGDNPGIIPRTLTTIFKSIKGREYRNPRIKPDMFNAAIDINENTLNEELKFKEGILTWNINKLQPDSKLYKTHSTVRSSVDDIFGESVFREMQHRLTNDTSIIEFEANPEDGFSVWVSFAEIYNEAIYDLLQPVTLSTKRKQLKLAQDGHKNYYIKGLKHVFVESEEEAYKVLMFGKTNLQVASTGMNTNSSRSHCIFTIKLIKSANVEHPTEVVVSSFSICDLAGAERQKKTLNVGLRLKESQNINCSLHVLSRCFSVIRENQLSNEHKMIPFRDSKLTQLFKHALTGKESVTMIVNVNPEPTLCEETQHVLKASAIAKHIVVQPKKIKRPLRETRQSMFSQIVTGHGRSTLIRWDSCVKPKGQGPVAAQEQPSETDLDLDKNQTGQYENVLALVEDLKEKLKEEKLKHFETKKTWKKREDEIRIEMKDELTRILEEAKQQNVLDMKRVQKIKEEIEYSKEQKPETTEEYGVNKRLKINEEEEKEFELSIEVSDLQEEIKMQQKHIDGLTDLVNMLKDEKKELSMELTVCKFNLGYKDREIENLKNKIDMFGEESLLNRKYLELEKEMNEKLQARDDLLDEARMDLLAELRAKDDLEEEISKLEKDITDREEEVLNLRSQVDELNTQLSDKEDRIDFLEAQIENMEFTEEKYEEEISSLKEKCCKLEEEIVRLSQQGDKHVCGPSEKNLHGSSEKLDQEIFSMTSRIEQLMCEKVALDELVKTQEEHCAFQEENIKKLNLLTENHEKEKFEMIKKYEEKLLANEELIRHLKRDITNQSYIIENLKSDLQNKALLIETLQRNLDDMKVENDLVIKEKNEKIADLTRKLEEDNHMSSLISDLEIKCQSLNEALLEKATEIEKLQKSIESMSHSKKEIETEYISEISMLQQSLKREIQETTKLRDVQNEKEKENKNLTKELSKLKFFIDELKINLKKKEHDLECCRSKMIGYEQSLPTLQSEFEMQRNECLEYKKRCEEQVATIINMEQELNSFQANKNEIIGRYEDQLKKKIEENDNLKREVASLANTFYKSTPTPKKDLEKQIEDQKNQLNEYKIQIEELEARCKVLSKENESLNSKLQQIETLPYDGSNKENEVSKGQFHSKRKTKPKSHKYEEQFRLRSHSCQDDSESPSDTDRVSKSATKTRPRRTTRAKAYPSIVVTDFEKDESDKPSAAVPKKPSRKKLWDASANDEALQLEDIEVDLSLVQDSPGTVYRRTLRNRNK